MDITVAIAEAEGIGGCLYHDDDVIFGEALVKAYRFETEIVHFPKIMITSSVRADLAEYLKDPLLAKELADNVIQDRDGPYFLHVLISNRSYGVTGVTVTLYLTPKKAHPPYGRLPIFHLHSR
jgi:hypothetical protein